MCGHSDGSHVKLLAWFQSPKRDKNPVRMDERGGHVALEFNNEGETILLGIWPGYWSLDQVENQPGKWRGRYLAVRKLGRTIYSRTGLKFLSEWAFPHRAKLTKYKSTQPNEPGIPPEEIESKMVMGRGVKIDEEALPDEEVLLCVKNHQGLIDFVNKINREGTWYNPLWRNCSTVCAEALESGGVDFKVDYFYWSPDRLYSYAKKHLACSLS